MEGLSRLKALGGEKNLSLLHNWKQGGSDQQVVCSPSGKGAEIAGTDGSFLRESSPSG